ncbi:hypothetical protein TRAPUB_6919 [Trametes pubescens]|uniref:Uncharacterized protein n=1 Tax=Trametes pubescens TaxID=154538 RepID=A0A1M2V4P3_TRAPU|nr:hypothetical protein TRAPUB_6919 [Trametes pubescens]
MPSSEFNFCDYLNLDMFEDDVPEDHEAMEASQASVCDLETHPFLQADVFSTDPVSAFQQAMQSSLELQLLSTSSFPNAPFDNTTNTPQATAEHEAALALQADVPEEAEHKVADSAEAQGHAEDDGTQSSEDTEQTLVAPQSDDSCSLPRPTPSPSSLPCAARSQQPQQSASSAEDTANHRSNKENAPLPNPSVDRREASPSRSVQYPVGVTTRRQHRAQEQQPVAGPSSITLDDLASNESKESESEQEPAAPTKRPRSTNDEVSSLQMAARKASVCRLDGGSCKHKLTDAPKKNKGHIKEAHPSLIPPTAGTPASTTGPLYYKNTLISDAKIRDFVTQDALACTWAAAPGAARCGSVFAGSAAQGSLARHVEEIHWGRKFACTQCTPSRPFGSLRTLQKHRRDKHSGTGGENAPKDGGVDEEDGEAEQEEEQPPNKRRRMK